MPFLERACCPEFPLQLRAHESSVSGRCRNGEEWGGGHLELDVVPLDKSAVSSEQVVETDKHSRSLSEPHQPCLAHAAPTYDREDFELCQGLHSQRSAQLGTQVRGGRGGQKLKQKTTIYHVQQCSNVRWFPQTPRVLYPAREMARLER